MFRRAIDIYPFHKIDLCEKGRENLPFLINKKLFGIFSSKKALFMDTFKYPYTKINLNRYIRYLLVYTHDYISTIISICQ